MSKDVSITDLIAEARTSAEVFGEKTLYGRMFIALENARITLDYDRDYIKRLEAKVDALEAVTVPPEDEYEDLRAWMTGESND
jgi:predicted RecB family endonuclease